MRRLFASLAIALGVAPAAGCADAPGGVAPAAAPHRVAWQQFCEQAWNVPQASALVAARGADGWELVAMYNGALCYKRPVAEAAPALRPAPQTPAPSGLVPLVHDPGF